MNKYLKLTILSFALPMLIFAGCAGRDEGTIGSPGNPLVLAFSAPYARNVKGAQLERLAERISSETGLTVKPVSFSYSVDTINEIGYEKADVVFVTLDEYLVAREEYRVKPALRVLRGKGLKEYRGVIVVLDKSVKSVKDLEGEKVAMNNPYSISGFIMPFILFGEKGVKVEHVFTGSHENSLRQLREGKVKAAAFYEAMAEKYKNLTVLAHTPAVPNEPVVCRAGLKEKTCGKVASVLMKISRDEEIAGILAGMADITGFEKTKPSVYKEVHEMILDSGKNIYDVVPGADEIKKINEGYFID